MVMILSGKSKSPKHIHFGAHGAARNESKRKESKKRRISWGPNLTPELFDLHLPPNSPLNRGAKPSPKSYNGPLIKRRKLDHSNSPVLNGHTGKVMPTVGVSPKKSPQKNSPTNHSSLTLNGMKGNLLSAFNDASSTISNSKDSPEPSTSAVNGITSSVPSKKKSPNNLVSPATSNKKLKAFKPAKYIKKMLEVRNNLTSKQLVRFMYRLYKSQTWKGQSQLTKLQVRTKVMKTVGTLDFVQRKNNMIILR